MDPPRCQPRSANHWGGNSRRVVDLAKSTSFGRTVVPSVLQTIRIRISTGGYDGHSFARAPAQVATSTLVHLWIPYRASNSVEIRVIDIQPPRMSGTVPHKNRAGSPGLTFNRIGSVLPDKISSSICDSLELRPLSADASLISGKNWKMSIPAGQAILPTIPLCASITTSSPSCVRL